MSAAVSNAKPNANAFATLRFVRQYMAEHNNTAPTLTEIAEALYFAPTTVVYQLNRLHHTGYLVREADTPRGLHLTGKEAP